MTRITKDPEERKMEIIKTAMELFNQKGFEQTAVSDIVKEIQIAQGTFYYYFKSKEDLLNRILEQFIQELINAVDSVVQSSEMNALQKLRQVIALFFSIGKNQEGPVFEYVHQEKNLMIHQKFSEKVLKMLHPLILTIIKEGKEQEVLSSDYPEEALEILLHGSIDYIHKFYFCKDRYVYNEKIEALTNTVERLFGAPGGSLKIT